MRVGMWAAAAAMALCAGQASAATFVQYQARGTGTIGVQNSGPTTFKDGDLFYTFVVETDPGYSSGLSFGNGSFYSYATGATLYSVSVSSGTISLNYTADQTNQYSPRSSATINLPSAGITTFSALPSSSPATGTVSYYSPTPYGGTSITGTITSLVRLGTVASYIDPSATVLPEPSVWAMMILGMAAIGYMLRRRRWSTTARGVAFS